MTVVATIDSHVPMRGQKIDAVLVAGLLIVGLYTPTSVGSDVIFMGPTCILSLVLMCCLVFRRGRIPSFPLAIGLLAVIPLLLLFTLTTGFNNPLLGELGQFTTLALLYMSYLRGISLPRWLFHLYAGINVINISAAIAIVAGNQFVGDFLIKYYSQFYAELVPGMLVLRKPVLTFGTHSLAGFFLYVFFYINWQTYRVKKSKLCMGFAICYLALTLAVVSVTGLVLSSVGMLQLLYGFWRSTKRKWLWSYSAALVAMLLAFQWNAALDLGRQVVEWGRAILTLQGSGFLGRLTPTGTMQGTLHYIMDHPFAPVGLSRNDEFLIADMGVLDYMIRGTIILVAWVYGGLFFFLKRNVFARADLLFLFIAIMMFELGFSALLYVRMPPLLAFFVLYLNDLRRTEGQSRHDGPTWEDWREHPNPPKLS